MHRLSQDPTVFALVFDGGRGGRRDRGGRGLLGRPVVAVSRRADRGRRRREHRQRGGTDHLLLGLLLLLPVCGGRGGGRGGGGGGRCPRGPAAQIAR